MKSGTLCIEKGASGPTRDNVLIEISRRILLSRLESLEHGELILNDGSEQYIFGRHDDVYAQTVTVTVTNREFYLNMLVNGVLGSGESYINDCWHCDNLTSLVELFLCNREKISRIGPGLKYLVQPLRLLKRFMHRNTLRGSRRNIEAHYDLGNELFALFLDDTMMYSCGIFHDRHASLRDASEAKLARICEKLQLSPADHVLEIGTGWGGFALYAARQHGCRVTTTTISRQQYEYALEQVKSAGLEDRITILFDDYRELQGQYDKLVSIEMIEAVGHRYFDTYFSKCNELLKPDGMMLLQSITIADQRYPQMKKSTDFIQQYIFPGGCLPSVAVLGDAIARKTNMRIFHLEDIGPHYATTLKKWRERFFANIEQVRQLGYPEKFIRMWEYYLCYCEGGFRQQSIGTVQLLLTKPRALRPALTSTDY